MIVVAGSRLRGRMGRAVAAGATLASTLVACGPTTTVCHERCDLPSAARAAGVRVGAAVTSGELRNAVSAAAVVANFTSVTPEFEMKWRVVRPTADTWSWSGADEVVDFAAAHGLSVRGHTLVWAKDASNPSWLTAMTDPVAFRDAFVGGITTEVARYAGRVDRWDVVNEPLSSTGSTLDANVFAQRLGSDYIELAFRTAHTADPAASLWLNEAAAESSTTRADALVALVTSLLGRGVPVHGVGLQTHVLSPGAPAAGRLADVVTRLRRLGLRVAVTELDVPTGPTRSADTQSDIYRQVAAETLGSGADELTTWGVGDGSTWLDSPAVRAELPVLAQYATPSNPLLLDAGLARKPCYGAVLEVLRALPPASR